MTTKDWKQIRNIRKAVTWKDKREYDKLLEVYNVSKGKWRVYTYNKRISHTLKYTKTKTKALAYAKAYMRKH